MNPNTLSAEKEKLHDEFKRFAIGNTFFHGTHNEMVEVTVMWWLDKVARIRLHTLLEAIEMCESKKGINRMTKDEALSAIAEKLLVKIEQENEIQNN